MSDESIAESELQTVLETLADPECRRILAELDCPRTVRAVAERCELPQTTAYRKIEFLSEAELVREGTKLRDDGHHVNTYERSVTGVVIALENDDGFEFELADEPRGADQRLAQFWSRISEEL